jgi:prophage regulatory protein
MSSTPALEGVFMAVAEMAVGGQRVIGRKELLRKTSLSRTTLWRLQQTAGFPEPIVLSTNRLGWLESEVDLWLSARPRGSVHAAAAQE